jgi:hypothetical protein
MLWSLALCLLYHTFADARSFRSEELKLFCRFLTLVVVNFSLGALASVLVEPSARASSSARASTANTWVRDS